VSLETVDLPAATTIGEWTFANTGTTALTVTLGATAPAVGTELFANVTDTKSVTVRVPADTTDYGTIPTYTGNDNPQNWGNAFRGKGWKSNDGYGSGTVNSNISLTIIKEPTP
jgi:hypothetical protein